MAKCRMMMKSHASRRVREQLVRNRGDVDYLLKIALSEEDRARIRYVYSMMMKDLDPARWNQAMKLFVYGVSIKDVSARTGLAPWKAEIVNENVKGPLREEVFRLSDEGNSTDRIAEMLNHPRKGVSAMLANRKARLNRIKRKEAEPKERFSAYLCDDMSSTQLMDAYIAKPFGYKWEKNTPAN